MISFSGVVRLTRLEQSKSLHGEHLEQLNLSQLLKSVISWKINIVTPCLKWYIHVICIYLLRQMSSQEFPKLCPPKLLKFILQMLILDNISVISRFFSIFMYVNISTQWLDVESTQLVYLALLLWQTIGHITGWVSSDFHKKKLIIPIHNIYYCINCMPKGCQCMLGKEQSCQ